MNTKTMTWTIDPVHSVAEFAVKHMMVSTVKGRFRSLEGTIHIDEENPTASWVIASIDVASIDTNDPQRDAHLRSADFFDAERFPKITFRSTRVEQVDETKWKLFGELTMRGVTKEVVLDTEYGGQIKDAFGKQRMAISAETTINRKDFGVNWNGLIEAGGVVVGDRVRIMLDIAAVRED